MVNKVLLIYTGGTIGMGQNPSTGTLEPLDFNYLLRQLPEFKFIKAEVNTYQFYPAIDSSDMTPDFWAQLVRIISTNYDDYDGFVILHGTDTMAYTASALSFMLENLTKPVILTGSQLPLGQLRTDGKENLITSIELASAHDEEGHAMVPEVCVYFSGILMRGNRSTKRNVDGFRAFDSYNYPHLCDAGVNFTYHSHHILTPDYSLPMIPHTSLDTGVVVFSLFPGIQEKFIKNVLNMEDLHGIVMRSFGSGNAPQAKWLTDILKKATERGVTVVNVTQCAKGRVAMDRYSTGYHLQQAGVISGYDSTVEAAVTKLMFLHARYSDIETIREKMQESLAGEITV